MLPPDQANHPIEELAQHHRIEIDKLLRQPRHYQNLEPTEAEKYVWGIEAKYRKIHQSTFQAGMHRIADIRTNYGKTEYLAFRNMDIGWQSYVISYTGQLLGDEKGLRNASFKDMFGAIDDLEQMHVDYGPGSIYDAVELLKKNPIAEITSKAMSATNFTYTEDAKVQSFNLLRSYISPSVKEDFKGDIVGFVNNLRTLNQALQSAEYQANPIIGGIAQNMQRIMDTDFIAGISNLSNSQDKELLQLCRDGWVTRQELSEILIKCQTLSTLAAHSKLLEKAQKRKIPKPGKSSGISMRDAKSPLLVMLRANHRLWHGDPKEQDPDKFHYAPVFSAIRNAGDVEQITLAIQDIKGINIDVTHEQPIVLITSPNGSGKTIAIKNISQTILEKRLTGGNSYAESTALEETEPPICLVNAAIDGPYASTFMHEMYDITRIQNTPPQTEGEHLPEVFLYDEIGRGTSSDEAANIICALSEMAVADGNYMFFSTHAASEVLTKARQTGLDRKIRIVTVDPVTHELIEVNGPVASQGVEYLKKISHRATPISKAFQTRTLQIKMFSQNGQAASHENIYETAIEQQVELNREREPIFCDQNSLKALSMSTVAGNDQVWRGIYRLANSQSADHQVFEHVLSHVEKATTFDNAVTNRDKKMIEELPFAIEKEHLDKAAFHQLIAQAIEIFDQLTKLPLSDETLYKVRQYVSNKDLRGLGSVLSTDENKRVAEFLNKYSQPKNIGKMLYRSGSPFQKINYVLDRTNIYPSEMKQLDKPTEMSEVELVFNQAIQRSTKSNGRDLLDRLDANLAAQVARNSYQFKSGDNDQLDTLLGGNQQVDLKNIDDTLKKILTDNSDVSRRALVRNWLLTRATSQNPEDAAIKRIVESSEYQSVIALAERAENNWDKINLVEFGRDLKQGGILSSILKSLQENKGDSLFWLNRELIAKDLVSEFRYPNSDFIKLMQTMDLSILVEWQTALSELERIRPPIAERKAALDQLLYCSTLLAAHEQLNCGTPIESSTGTTRIVNAYPIEQLERKSPDDLTTFSARLDSDTDIATVIGFNGNGKSQFTKALGTIKVIYELSGLAFAQHSTLGKTSYVRVIQNAGLSTPRRSSFNSEGAAMLNTISELPISKTGEGKGLLIYDEIGATTSNEDQVHIVAALTELLRKINCQLLCTTHNREIYDGLRSNGIEKVQVFAFPYDPQHPYKMVEVDTAEAKNVRSNGILKAAEMGMPEHVIKIAQYYESIPL